MKKYQTQEFLIALQMDLSQGWEEENEKVKYETQHDRRETASPTCGFPSLAHGKK